MESWSVGITSLHHSDTPWVQGEIKHGDYAKAREAFDGAWLRSVVQ